MSTPTTTDRPLRIGLLGAARIADDGIVEPARLLGHHIVAVAARDRGRAEMFATERGIATVHGSYADVLADPDVDVVYNALVNSLHHEWNIAALQAGKHVLSEKPLTSNAAQTRQVVTVAEQTGGVVVEGFHYQHHPLTHALRETVTSGRLGDIERVEIVLAMPSPPDTDPRWAPELAGGATMDMGCYVLSAAQTFGTWIGVDRPEITSVQATLRSPDMDAAMRVGISYGSGVVGRCIWDMDAADRTMTWKVVGSRGTALLPTFAVPAVDNRLLLTVDGHTTGDRHGDQTSYTYQLAAFADTVQNGTPFCFSLQNSITNAELIDECYRRAGLHPRG